MLRSTGNITPSLTQVHPQTIHAIEAAFARGRFPIVLHGPTGCGKSCVAALLAMCWPEVRHKVPETGETYVIDAHQPCFTTSADVVRDMDSFRCSMAFRAEACSLWIMDDVRPVHLPYKTDLGTEALLWCLNARANRPQVITCNWHPEELGQKMGDARAGSRLLAGGRDAWVAFPNIDRRIQP